MFFISLDETPVSWQAPQFSRGYTYDPREREKKCIRYLINQAWKGSPIEDYVHLIFIFTFPIPKSYSKKKIRQIHNGELFPTKSDCTNLQKLYEDCLKKIVINDDRQVINVTSIKRFGDKGNVFIKITPAQFAVSLNMVNNEKKDESTKKS